MSSVTSDRERRAKGRFTWRRESQLGGAGGRGARGRAAEGGDRDRGVRSWSRSLALRVGLVYAALFLLGCAALLVAAHRATHAALTKVERQVLLEELAFQRARYAPDGAPTSSGSSRFFVRVLGEDGALLSHEGPAVALPAPEPPGDPRGTIEVEGADERRWTVAGARIEDGRWVWVGMAHGWRKASLSELTGSYAWILGAAALLGLLGGGLLTRRMLRPIVGLAEATQRVVRQGDFGARVARTHSGDELDRLAGSFNDMLAHNERLVRAMRDALDHVAHDLRTPLTRLRATAELALRERHADTQRDALADVVEESDRVLSMLRTMTDISEAECGVLRLSTRPLELGAVAREVVDLYAHVADEAGVTLRADLREPVMMQADAVRIAQALANLVDNAIKYTRPGGEVVVQVAAEGRTAVLRVRDTGIGIPAASLTRIWERLYRVDASRTQRGLGLGLSFVKAIVEAHGGVAIVESTPGRGSTFELRLPR